MRHVEEAVRSADTDDPLHPPGTPAALNVPDRIHRVAPGEIHVWQISLVASAHRVSRLRALLSDAEREREQRLRFERDRVRFVCRRGALRSILNRYTGIDADRLIFLDGSYGKPELTDRGAAESLQFNLSYSNDLALGAITAGAGIGVDVEKTRAIADLERVATHFFSCAEQEALAAIPVDDRPLSFLRCWTRKEAFVKARGDGLSFPLQRFDVSLRPGDPAALLRIDRDLMPQRRWWMTSFEPGAGYVAALVVDRPACHVSWWPRFGEDA